MFEATASWVQKIEDRIALINAKTDAPHVRLKDLSERIASLEKDAAEQRVINERLLAWIQIGCPLRDSGMLIEALEDALMK